MFKYEKMLSHYEDTHTLEQDIQKGCGVSILEDIQNPTGHIPGQPDLAAPALSRARTRRSPKAIPHIRRFYDSLSCLICLKSISFAALFGQ